MGTYWTRKDDHSEEMQTVKPWDESIANGDKFIPEPNQDKKENK